jgi:hypothetical protein
MQQRPFEGRWSEEIATPAILSTAFFTGSGKDRKEVVSMKTLTQPSTAMRARRSSPTSVDMVGLRQRDVVRQMAVNETCTPDFRKHERKPVGNVEDWALIKK